jgi:hypothetical protein
MSAGASVRTTVLVREDAERGHKIRLMLAWLLALALVLVVAGYGLDYYTLSAANRPFSPKHELLRPSGPVGIKLGMLGVFLTGSDTSSNTLFGPLQAMTARVSGLDPILAAATNSSGRSAIPVHKRPAKPH